MKITGIALAFLIAITISCKKDGIDKTEQGQEKKPRIVKLYNDLSKFEINYGYDDQARVNFYSYQSPPQAAVNSNIGYSNNYAALSAIHTAGNYVYSTNTTYIFDVENKLAKFIRYESVRQVPITNFSYQILTYDSAVYSYNTSGVVRTVRIYGRDTIFQNGTKTVRLDTLTTQNTIVGGNITSTNDFVNSTLTDIYSNGSTNSWRETIERNTAYSYVKNYKNQTDFSNAWVFNVVRPINNIQFNAQLANLPDRITGTSVTKDQNGTVTASSNSDMTFEYTYNTIGNLSEIVCTSDPYSSFKVVYEEK